jgi:hypothetical protein
VISRKQVSVLCNQFKEERMSLLDEERAGRPTTARNAVNERRVEQFFLTDCRTKLKETATSYSSKTCWNAYSRCQTFALQCNSPHCWKNTWKHWEDGLGNSRTPLPHSPDLASSDFHLFGKLKGHLSGKRFDSDHEVENETRNWLTNLDANFYADAILKLVSRWDKYLNLFRDYVEK